jgi:two-component system, NarL family, sensor histidine kinase DesK
VTEPEGIRFGGRRGLLIPSLRGLGFAARGGLGSSMSPHRSSGVRIVASTVWLAFIVFPLLDAVGHHRGSLPHGVIILGAVLFVGGYLGLVLSWRRADTGPLPLVMFGLLLAVATVLTLTEKSGWGFLFTYCAACAAIISPDRLVLPAVGLCVVLAGVTSAVGGSSGGTTLGAVASTAGIGLLMLLMRDLRARNLELQEARAELARMAVAEERERFARDLHDLLGHTLSVITIKAELAGRLLPSRPADAAREVADVEEVARNALSEVRQAVSGYRQPTLEGELAGARVALSAAGIEAHIENAPVKLDPRVESVLAWAVREGATNVIRHSGARHCTMRIGASLRDAEVEVTDDGAGPGDSISANGNGGHGLAGLAERAQGLNGRVEAGSRPEGGFRLAVTVPVGPA